MPRSKRQRLNMDGDYDTIEEEEEEDNGTDTDDNEESFGIYKKLERQKHGRSLFVRSLPANATSESLATLFSQSFPLKHATVVLDSKTRESKGYGFVTFADLEDAQSAQKAFNGFVFEGRKIQVELAERRSRQTSEGDRIDGRTIQSKPNPKTPKSQPSPKLIVRNLPWSVKRSEDLVTLFRSYGKVKYATIPQSKPGRSAGYGFVTLRGRKNAERALKGVNGTIVEGRTLAVDWAVEKALWETLQNEDSAAVVNEPNHLSAIADQDTESIRSQEPNGAHANEALNGIYRREVFSSIPQQTPSKGTMDDEVCSVTLSERNASTLFLRNVPFTITDEALREHFEVFGPVSYARVVLDPITQRSKGTAFVRFQKQEHANLCLWEAPGLQVASTSVSSDQTGANMHLLKQSLLEDRSMDLSGRYTLEGRVLQINQAVDHAEATRLTFANNNLREARDKDKRRLYLLSEGTINTDNSLYSQFSASEIQMREDSKRQRQSLVRSNPTLNLSLTRLSIRNLPRSITSKELKALAREAVVGFAKEVKAGVRKQLSKEELSRGSERMREAEKDRKAKGKGIVKQVKIVFEGRGGGKVTEESRAGRSRGYGFIEYYSHRWALMGLRWLNGQTIKPSNQAIGRDVEELKKRPIVEFAIENAQVVGRRQERETKARERSKLISEKRSDGDNPPKPAPTTVVVAQTRDYMETKPPFGTIHIKQNNTEFKGAARGSNEKFVKRHQIVGRKRKRRQSRHLIKSS